MKQIAVIGDGGWGTALALVLHRNGHAVRVWGPFEDYVQQLRTGHENAKFLPGIELPPALEWTADPREAVAGAQAVVLAMPSKFYRPVLERFRSLITPDRLVVSVTKGLDKDTHQRMTQTAQHMLDGPPVVALSGPSHAEEVARGIPAAIVAACTDPAAARATQELFNAPVFRVYTSDDVVGVELGGALKNVIALAAGVSDGIGYGDNTKAALMTRGLAEMTRLGTALGAHPATFSGLSGVGDLIVTCTSKHSRNRRVGESLGRGATLAELMATMEQVAEGVWNCANARALAAEHGVDMPITEEVYAMVHEDKNPRDAVTDLLTRDPRPERDG
jgi:glycerol-3-phosphate dehydrogenase (NAD(P)+)